MAERLPEKAWYAIGGAETLAPGEVMPVRLFGDERAAWRGENGKSHVWQNRCVHRGMRLQFGFVDGDRLACRYHGWRFGGDAHCEIIPAHPDMTPPEDYCIPSYASTEKYGFIWTATGTPEGDVTDLPNGEKFVFCRSLAIQSPAESVCRHLESSDAPPIGPGLYLVAVTGDDAAFVVAVAVQPVGDDKAQIHLSVECADTPNDLQNLRLDVSGWGRRLRDTIEAENGKDVVA